MVNSKRASTIGLFENKNVLVFKCLCFAGVSNHQKDVENFNLDHLSKQFPELSMSGNSHIM